MDIITDDSPEETIEGFRVQKSTSKKLHDLLEAEGITKKKWLEIKIDSDLQHKMLGDLNKNNSILIPKQHYARLLSESHIEDSVDEVYDYIESLIKKNPTWSNYLSLFSAFCNSSGFNFEIDDKSTYTTINLKHNVSERFTNLIELLWIRIAKHTKEVKLESCIKTDISIIMKFEKL